MLGFDLIAMEPAVTAKNSLSEDAVSHEELLDLGARLQQALKNRADSQQPVAQAVTDVMLAAFVARNLHHGGFAQLFFNAQGGYLREMADMLQNVNARNTLNLYERAVRVCLADKLGYQSFLASDFVSDSTLKNALHEVSLDYFASGLKFEDEAAAQLRTACRQARQWLISADERS